MSILYFLSTNSKTHETVKQSTTRPETVLTVSPNITGIQQQKIRENDSNNFHGNFDVSRNNTPGLKPLLHNSKKTNNIDSLGKNDGFKSSIDSSKSYKQQVSFYA